MQRSTVGASLGSSARGIPLTTSSAYVTETMRDLPGGASHPYVASSSNDPMDPLSGRNRPGKRGPADATTGGSAGTTRGGVVGTKGGEGGMERRFAADPQHPLPPHWCLQSLHPGPELVASGDAAWQPSEYVTSNSAGRTRKTDLSGIYFPWTLGESASAASGSRLPPATSVVVPGSCAARHINTAGYQRQQRSRPGGHRCGRSGSGLSSPSSASNSSVDRIHTSSGHEDSRPGSHQKVLLSSPFESTITQLRLDRLRIEEEHLLEIKRQEELERIRGPQPKWYALKSSEFGRELRRHNDLLKTSDGGRDQGAYRDTLERASQHFQQAYYSQGQ